MTLLTPDLCVVLRANAVAHHDAMQCGGEETDPCPVVKLFNLVGPATWLATELYADGDTLFGLADLGFGCPELELFSLAEIAAVRLSFGLCIERDLTFATAAPLSRWADMARRHGSIISVERELRRARREQDAPA
jgi:Protein of unknown function (DUF2958)